MTMEQVQFLLLAYVAVGVDDAKPLSSAPTSRIAMP